MRKIRIERLVVLTIVLLGSFVVVKGAFFQQPYSVPTASDLPYYVQYARVDGALFQVPNMISNSSVDRTLVASESGSTVYFTAGSANDITGIATVTLPAPTVGLVYDVNWGTSLTAGSLEVRTNTGTVLISGGITVNSANGTGAMAANCNGTTHVAVRSNGTTTGGLIGSWLSFKAVSTTQWNVTGILAGSGTAATPCTT